MKNNQFFNVDIFERAHAVLVVNTKQQAKECIEQKEGEEGDNNSTHLASPEDDKQPLELTHRTLHVFWL